MKFRTLLLFILLGQSDFSHALYGGRPVTSSRFGAVVSLHLNDPENEDYDYFCSGVLITPTKVLTTGHCIDGMSREVYDDAHYLAESSEHMLVKTTGQERKVVRVTLAPSYFEAPGYEGEDLALVEISAPFKNIKPIPITQRSQLKKGTPLLMVAKGIMAKTTLLSMKLYKTVPVLTMDGRDSGVCQGDSGGALLVEKNGQYELAGVLRFEGQEGCEMMNGVAVFPRERF